MKCPRLYKELAQKPAPTRDMKEEWRWVSPRKSGRIFWGMIFPA